MQTSTDRRSRTSSCIFFPPPAPAWTAPNMLTNLLPLAPLLWSLSSKRKGLDETPQHEKQGSAGSTCYAEERRPRWCSQHLGMPLPVTLPQETRLSQEVTETPAQQERRYTSPVGDTDLPRTLCLQQTTQPFLHGLKNVITPNEENPRK